MSNGSDGCDQGIVNYRCVLVYTPPLKPDTWKYVEMWAVRHYISVSSFVL